MAKLEELRPNASVRGIVPDVLVSVINLNWFGDAAVELTYKTPSGKVSNVLLYRDKVRVEIVEHGRPWSFDGDGYLQALYRRSLERLIRSRAFFPATSQTPIATSLKPHSILFDVIVEH